jgi:hypothetical protein
MPDERTPEFLAGAGLSTNLIKGTGTALAVPEHRRYAGKPTDGDV